MNPNIIDLILLAIAVYFVLLGLSRGLLRSIFGPIALIAGSWLAYAYYLSTHQTFVAVCLGFIAPMAISFLLKFIVAGWLKSLNPEEEPDIISRLAGALVTLLWGWVFVIFAVIFIEFFPGFNKTIKDLHASIKKSHVVNLTITPFKNLILPPAPQSADDAEIKQLAQDPRIIDLMNDPEIQRASKNNDVAAMLKNPKVMKLTQEMMKDPELLKKMMAGLQQIKEQQKSSK